MDCKRSTRLERLRWRSRRGLLELELLLLPFVDAEMGDLSDGLLARFEKLLDCDDMDIYEWLMARSEPERELVTIVAEVRGFLARTSV